MAAAIMIRVIKKEKVIVSKLVASPYHNALKATTKLPGMLKKFDNNPKVRIKRNKISTISIFRNPIDYSSALKYFSAN
jgi:hypothetical protein